MGLLLGNWSSEYSVISHLSVWCVCYFVSNKFMYSLHSRSVFVYLHKQLLFVHMCACVYMHLCACVDAVYVDVCARMHIYI